jgi:hypothetical protein
VQLDELLEEEVKPKRKGRPPGSKNKPKELDPDAQIAKASSIVRDAHAPTMVAAKRRGRPPAVDPGAVPHEKQLGEAASWKKNWTVELHNDHYVFLSDGKKVGTLATKSVDAS